jgi:hypothetical protein
MKKLLLLFVLLGALAGHSQKDIYLSSRFEELSEGHKELATIFFAS